MKKRTILYFAIAIVCIIAIIVAVYQQLFAEKVVNVSNAVPENKVGEEKAENPKDALTEFNKLFTNKFYRQQYSVSNITKIPGLEEKNVIYTQYDIKKDEDGIFSVDIKLPVFNVKSDVVSKFNTTTQEKFADKASEILQRVNTSNNNENTTKTNTINDNTANTNTIKDNSINSTTNTISANSNIINETTIQTTNSGTNKYTIYNIEYVAYLNDNILSLAIKSTLKEGNSAQRVIVQTYNYDIIKDKEVILSELLKEREIDADEVNKKIDKQVREAAKQAKTISEATGQIVYTRNLDDARYAVDNITDFFIGENGQIYIVYAYGNNNITSEIDIVKVD